WLGAAPLPAALPSPKFHVYVRTSVAPGSEPDPANVIAAPSLPLFDGPAFAVGARFATVTCTVLEFERLPSSRTVNVAVNVPKCVCVWFGVAPLPAALPSPKSHVYVRTSEAPGSVAEPANAIGEPSLPLRAEPAFAVGARFATVTCVVLA